MSKGKGSKKSNSTTSKKKDNVKRQVKPIKLEVKNNKKKQKVTVKSFFKTNIFMRSISVFLSASLLVMSICLIISIVKEQKDKPTVVNNYKPQIINENNGIFKMWKGLNNEVFTFNSDLSFVYSPTQDSSDGFYKGTYTYTNGEEAISEMGYSIEEFIKAFGEVAIENVYSMKLEPNKAYLNDKEETLENTMWWFILIMKEDDTAIAYNKTLDIRYSLT